MGICYNEGMEYWRRNLARHMYMCDACVFCGCCRYELNFKSLNLSICYIVIVICTVVVYVVVIR
jgi:hypothetical protein